MSGKKITWIIVGVVVAILVLSAIGGYNNLVNLSEDVNNKLSQIDNQLQLRNDLIPNLVATVKGFAAHEEEILKNVSDARAKLAGASSVEQMAEGDAELTGALSRLLVVVENYPDLKAMPISDSCRIIFPALESDICSQAITTKLQPAIILRSEDSH